MGKLFTEEFRGLLDELQSLDNEIKRRDEDMYNVLIGKNIITENDIHESTRTIIARKVTIRNSLRTLFNESQSAS